ncbi:MAG TPA: TonB-dependent receptor [archaeon]|nr:TonB-dependent receptor [archaeon]
MSKFSKTFGIPGSALSVALVTFLWCASGAFAQLSTSKIEGVVRDKDTGAPLAGVQVTVEGTRLGNVTNDDGYYFILNVPPGRKSVTFTYTGYQKTTVANQLLLAGQTTTVDANPSSTVVELEGITIQGEAEILAPRDQTVTKRRLTAEAISETPASRLEDIMVLEAGVQFGGPEAYSRSFQIRGGRRGEEAMVVDGVMVRNYTADPFTGGTGWWFEQEEGSLTTDPTPLEFSTSAVEEVDIITGGFQAEYGNAQSGVINIVTKEGGPTWKGNVRFTTDEINPRTADYGYNQMQASLGGPVPAVNNLYLHVSGEFQGMADRFASHADEGFRGINQRFVDDLNYAVKNDPIFGEQQPAYTLEMFEMGRDAYIEKVGSYNYPWSPQNPVRQPGNWGDRHMVSGKLTYTPIQELKFIASSNFSRLQNSYPWGRNGKYDQTGLVTISTLPNRAWDMEAQRFPDVHPDPLPDTVAIIPQAYGRRTRTTNMLAGVDWDFLRTAQRSGSLQFRYTNFRTQDINSANIKDNYLHDNTFMSWTPHDLPFELETYPDKNLPVVNTEDARIYYPDGVSSINWEFNYPTVLGPVFNSWLYYLNYDYSREDQGNYKTDIDFQINRQNRAKIGGQFTDFSIRKINVGTGRLTQKVYDQFKYKPRMFAFYLQNRTDLGDFVFDYGIRYDEFQPRTNWGFRAWDTYAEHYFIKNISEWSPRFDVAFPVTDKSQIRFSYGVFTQLPSLSFIFNTSNPGGLEYSRTDAFEAGLSYLMSDNIVVDLVSYYRDVDGNLAQKEFFRDYVAWYTGKRYRTFETGFTNRDNGNIKGLDLTVKRRFSNNFAFNLIYTLQFSRTTASQYNSTAYYYMFMDPSTGAEYRPPDDLKPIDGDRTHKATVNFTYLFPDDFRAGTLTNTILKNLRANAIFTFQSGAPVVERVVAGGETPENLNLQQQLTWITRRGSGNGYVIGGLNFFRNRWNYNLDLRLSKGFRIGGTRRLDVFCEIFNALNQKPVVREPTGYSYEGSYSNINGGEVLPWSDDLRWEQKNWFVHDYDQNGVLSLEEQAKASIARSLMYGLMDKTSWGLARQIRSGVQFSF